MTVGIGTDIKEVFSELGASFSIITRDPVVTGEKVTYELNAQATKPFIREHHLDAAFAYDTAIEVTDVIHISETDKYYMVMNKTPELFEGEVVEWSSVLYLCNLPSTVRIVRPIEIRNSSTYKMVQGWTDVVDPPIYGLLTDRIFGSEIEQEEPLAGQIQVWRIDLYVPKSYGVKPLDRLIVSDTEYYKIESVESYYYPGVNVALLVEDTRPRTIIIDGEVYND
jgi:hypothetical protein